jgi:glycosyltransferase involved in cell wall biosynthesis
MKKVLVVAYHYPPVGGSGVFRTLKFTKYLPQFDFRPYVLTVKNSMYTPKDPTLVKEIPPEARVIATFSFEHRILRASRLLNIDPEWFFITDVNLGWLPFAVHTGTKIIRQENIDVIYVTAPIWTSLLIGYLLKKKTQKPLVIDFRDPWTINLFKKTPTKFHARIENWLERRVLASADYVITVSQPYKRRLIEKYPFLKTRFEVIMNGFDPDDFKDLKRQPLQGKFRIVHTGSLYGLRTPKYFLLALQGLVREKEYLRKQIEVQFIGNYGKETPILVDKLGLNDLVQFIGYLPHERCLELMVNSHILLLIVASEGNKASGIVTGKLFEYLISGRPILALAPNGSIVANIVQSANAGLVVSSDVEAIKNTILKFYEQWTEGKLSITTDMASIERYNRKVLTRKLAQIFEKVIPQKTVS